MLDQLRGRQRARRGLTALVLVFSLMLAGETRAQSPEEERTAAALAAVKAFRALKPGGKAVMVPSAELVLHAATWELHGFAITTRDTTASAALRIRGIRITGDTAVVEIEAALREALRPHVEWREVTLIRRENSWLVTDVRLTLIT